MKKIIALFAFLLIALIASAQDKVINTPGLYGVTNTAAARKTAAYNYVFRVNVGAPYYYSYSVRQNDEGGAPANNTSTAYFQGSADGTNYVNIDTISYGGSSTYQISNDIITSAPLSYAYLRFNFTPSDTIWIKSIWLNVLPVK